MNKIQRTLAIAAVAFCAAGAQAATLYNTDFSPTGFVLSPDSMSMTFSAAAGNALLDFKLAGFNTLDGDNEYIDVFHLGVNGSEVFSGTFNLGGGGVDRVLLAPSGTGIGRLSPNLLTIFVPLSLMAGTNTVTFSYTSPHLFDGTYREGPEGVQNEGWGIGRISVSAVPEPETYAMLLAGIGVVGLTLSRRQRRDR